MEDDIIEYGYVNTNGEMVMVTEDHLNKAVSIKIELQKMSPSRRCSWRKHKELMAKEGFNDSDTNENYRCLVKRYQKLIGKLPTMKQYADMVESGKLDSIKQEIGRLNGVKLALQDQATKTRRLVRETNRDVVLIEEIARAIKNTRFIESNNPVVLPDWRSDEDNSMIVCLSDIHYGANVDIPENYYNTKVVRALLLNYAAKIIKQIKKNNVTSVDIVNLGDIVEHAYMRNQNLYDSEETLSEQIVNVSKLIIEFIQNIRNHVELVTYRGIAGNHDRMQGDKKSNLNTDHAVNISNNIIKMWIELSQSDVKFIESDSYFAEINVRGYNFGFVHGDRNNMNKKSTLAELGEQHDRHYDAILAGHIHHFTMQEVGNNRYQATFGSIKGMDDYSIKLGSKACRSQGFVLVNNDGFDIRKVNL